MAEGTLDRDDSVARGGLLRDGDALLDTALALADVAQDDPDEALRRIAGELRDLTGSRFCAIYSLEGPDLRILTVNEHGAIVDDDVGRLVPAASSGPVQKAVRTGTPQAVVDYGLPICNASLAAGDPAGAGPYESALLLPMVFGRRAVGMVELCDRVTRDYLAERVVAERLVRVAARAAAAAALARRHAARELLANELLKFGDVIGEAQTVEEFVRPLAEKLRTALAVEDCDVWQKQGDDIICLASVDSGGWDDEVIGEIYRLADYPSYEAAARSGTMRIVRSPDDPSLGERERESLVKWGFRSNLSVFLRVQDETVGFIDVFDVRERDFSEHIDFLNSVGRLVAGAFHKALLLEEHERSNRNLRLVLDISRAITSTSMLEEALTVVARKASEALDIASCIVNEYVPEIDALVARAAYDLDAGESFDGTGVPRHLSDYPGDRAILEGGEIVIEQASDPDLDPSTRDSMLRYDEKTCLNLPLVVKGEPVGILMFLETRRERHFAPHELELARAVGEQAALAIQNVRLLRALRQKTETDGLTGLFNTRFLRQRAFEHLAAVRRHGLALSLVMLEVDSFRRFSLDHGRAVGNDLLNAVAEIVKTRGHPHIDVAAHLGNGRFALLLPYTPLDGSGDQIEPETGDGWLGPHAHGALGVAERLCADVASLSRLASGSHVPRAVTASLGVAAVGSVAGDTDELLEAAGSALTRAVKAGGNRVDTGGD
jgi:GAF domain-containing protein